MGMGGRGAARYGRDVEMWGLRRAGGWGAGGGHRARGWGSGALGVGEGAVIYSSGCVVDGELSHAGGGNMISGND